MVWKTESPSGMDAWDEHAVLIAQELREWSHAVLEQQAPLFGNLPPCPFAARAWAENSVMIHVTPDLEAVTEIKAYFPPTEDLVHLFAWTDYQDMTSTEFDAWVESQNKQHFGVWVMGFHPDSPQDPLTPEFNGLIEDDYAIVLVQSLKHLVRASDALRKTAYYSKFPASDMEYVNRRKEISDAWYEKVDEKTCDAEEERALQSRLTGKETTH